MAQLEQILDILSCMEPNRKEPLTKLETAVMEEIAGIGSAVLLLLKWDDDRRKLVEHMRGFGVQLKIIVISDEASSSMPKGPQISHHHPQDILTGKVTEL